MAKYLIWLLLLGTSNVFAEGSCYADSWTNSGMPVLSTVHGRGNITTAQCIQSACQIWPTDQGCPGTIQSCTEDIQTQTIGCPSGYQGSITQTNTKTCPSGTYSGWVTSSNTCQPIIRTETQTLSCPVHQSGQITQTRTVTAGQPSAWQTIQNTCVQDPPSCQTNIQTQTLSCQTGYVGLITQTKTSTCPDPYGNPLWGSWMTALDTCVKSLTNPTNLNSPVSPISPVNPTSSISAPTIQSSVVTAPTQSSVQNLEVTPTVNTTTSVQPTTSATPATPSLVTGANTQPKPKVALVLSLELTAKPSIIQPNLLNQTGIAQTVPMEFLIQDSIMGLMFQPTIKQFLEPQDMGYEQ